MVSQRRLLSTAVRPIECPSCSVMPRASCDSVKAPTRSGKYMNNAVEQDHRRVKRRIRCVLGFKHEAAASITLAKAARQFRLNRTAFTQTAIHSTRSIVASSGRPRIASLEFMQHIPFKAYYEKIIQAFAALPWADFGPVQRELRMCGRQRGRWQIE